MREIRAMLTLLVSGLVDEPGRVLVEAVKTSTSVTFKVQVAKADVPRLLGKGGRMARTTGSTDWPA